MVVFTPSLGSNCDGSSRCGYGFCAGACGVKADTGRSRARLCGLQACQQRQVIGNYRRPDVSLEVLEAAPGGTSQAVGALETRDAGLDAGAEVSQPAVHPAALDHVFDRQAALLVEGHVGDAPGLGLVEIVARCIATISHRLTRRAAVERDVAIQHGQEAFAVGRVARLGHQVEDKASSAAGQVELLAVARLATALEDDVGVRLE